jgi:hypothetical protein
MISSSRPSPLAALLDRVREQYREMPGLMLTRAQAMRLFDVAPSVCAAMLKALVLENFLSRTADGVFVRSTVIAAVSDVPLSGRFVSGDLTKSN